jgi:hypothetical protein
MEMNSLVSEQQAMGFNYLNTNDYEWVIKEIKKFSIKSVHLGFALAFVSIGYPCKQIFKEYCCSKETQ